MKLTPATLRAAYDFLRRVAFDDDKNLPPSRAVRFVARRSKFHGYLVYERKRYTIGVDTVGTTSVDLLLQIMSHEMIHLARRDRDVSDEDAHDTLFQAAAHAVEQQMGWPKGSV